MSPAERGELPIARESGRGLEGWQGRFPFSVGSRLERFSGGTMSAGVSALCAVQGLKNAM